MLGFRQLDYRHKQWGYFLLDFCYFAQLTQAVQIALLPGNCALAKVNFAFATGPLFAAVLLWRNSLVFHDQEKVVTVWVHVLPGWLAYAARWQDTSLSSDAGGGGGGGAHFKGRLAALGRCEPFGAGDYGRSLGLYAAWQLLYFIKTEVCARVRFEWRRSKLDSGADGVPILGSCLRALFSHSFCLIFCLRFLVQPVLACGASFAGAGRSLPGRAPRGADEPPLARPRHTAARAPGRARPPPTDWRHGTKARRRECRREHWSSIWSLQGGSVSARKCSCRLHRQLSSRYHCTERGASTLRQCISPKQVAHAHAAAPDS